MQSLARNLLPDIRDMLYLSMDSDQAAEWLTTDNPALGNTSPMRCLTDGKFADVYSAVLKLSAPQK